MKPGTGELERIAHRLRKVVLETCIRAGTGHLTSSLSCVDILTVLYHGGILRVDPVQPSWPERDRFIMSKGQASPALYAVLADLGFFDPALLEGFAREGGRMGVHLQRDIPGVEITTGSLGHGLGIGAGLALAAAMDGRNQLTVVLLGDGECHEGSVWEAAMFAAHHRLRRLVAVIDRNWLCATDFTERVVKLEPLVRKWESFGWAVRRVDGHSMAALSGALKDCRRRRSGKPLAVIADTVKGKGIPSIANIPLWHGQAPRGGDVETCRRELDRHHEDE